MRTLEKLWKFQVYKGNLAIGLFGLNKMNQKYCIWQRLVSGENLFGLLDAKPSCPETKKLNLRGQGLTAGLITGHDL